MILPNPNLNLNLDPNPKLNPHRNPTVGTEEERAETGRIGIRILITIRDWD